MKESYTYKFEVMRIMAKRSNPEYLNGVPELLLLRLLDSRPMYGYELVQQIVMTTGQRLEFGEGCIYPLLHRLEAEGSLSSRRKQVENRSRVIYRVTRKGKKKLATSVERWNRVVEAVEMVLHGGTDEQVAFT